MTTRRTLTVLGVTGAGKSTWLGALADGLHRGFFSRVLFDDDNWPTDTSGLDRAKSYVQKGEYPRHTTRDAHGVIELPLRVERGPRRGETFSLKVSDYDGELIDRLFLEREDGWDDGWSRRARADAFLVMIRHDFTRGLRKLKHPEARRPPVRPLGADPMTASSPEELAGEPLPDRWMPSGEQVTQDQAQYVPTTLALVEMLQWIRHERELLPAELTPVARPLRVGIVLTGWDSISATYKQALPGDYFAAHHGLLNDFLRTNFREQEFQIFALSATGGNLTDPFFRERYLASDTPLSFVQWSADGRRLVTDSDLSAPLCWALFGDPGLSD